jgi:hypothetical protein
MDRVALTWSVTDVLTTTAKGVMAPYTEARRYENHRVPGHSPTLASPSGSPQKRPSALNNPG